MIISNTAPTTSPIRFIPLSKPFIPSMQFVFVDFIIISFILSRHYFMVQVSIPSRPWLFSPLWLYAQWYFLYKITTISQFYYVVFLIFDKVSKKK